MRVKFINAGIRSANAPILFYAAKTFLPLVFTFAGYFALRIADTSLDSNTLILYLLIIATIGCYLPNILLSRAMKARKREIFENFPDAADLMLVCVEAGLGLDAALVRVADEMRITSRALTEEIHLTTLETRAGNTRAQALRNLGLRTGVEEINTFATMLSQADKFGTSIGESLRPPVLAVDLHYLITAYSKSESQAEVMLGEAAHLLHDQPLLTQKEVRAVEIKWRGENDPFLKKLAESGLSDQLEMVRLAPEQQTTEELSKLWSAFQTHYRPTVAYLASVLLIEAEGPTRKPLPVLKVGDDDRGPVVGPSLILPIPLLVAAELPDREITAVLSDTLIFRGYNLDGTNSNVEFRSLRDNRRLTANVIQTQTKTEISVKLTDAKDSVNPGLPAEEAWSVGPYAATVTIRKADEEKDRQDLRRVEEARRVRGRQPRVLVGHLGSADEDLDSGDGTSVLEELHLDEALAGQIVTAASDEAKKVSSETEKKSAENFLAREQSSPE